MIPRTRALFEPILHALHQSAIPLTVKQLSRAVHASNAEVSDLLYRLRTEGQGYSPVRKLANDCYTLTRWARQAMLGGCTPADPRYTTVSLLPELPADRHLTVTAAFAGSLREWVTQQQTTKNTTRTELLTELHHALVDEYYHLISDIDPQALYPYLEAALEEVERVQPFLQWGAADDESVLVAPGLKQLSHVERLNDLAWCLMNGLFRGALRIPSEITFQSCSPESTVHLSTVSSSETCLVHLGSLGKTITAPLVKQVAACTSGERAIIVSLGRITPEAQELADSLNVTIVTMEVALSQLHWAEWERARS